jgi:F-type H+-transporting ATPase subunit delta
VAKRYARALFELAKDKDILSIIEEDIKNVQKVYEKSEDFKQLLESPVIQISEKKKVFEELFKNKINSIFFNFLILLLEKGREDLLPTIVKHFFQLSDELRGIIRGHLKTAHLLDKEQLTIMKKRLDQITSKNVVIEQKIDPELIGGFVIKMDDTVIDNSIRNQLMRMYDNLVSKR